LQAKQHFLIAPPKYAEIHITFQSDLLFPKCQWTPSDAGKRSLHDQACLLWKFSNNIERIEIEGYSDQKPADNCRSLQGLKGIGMPADNLLLSSFRAIAVRNELGNMAGASCGGEATATLSKIQVDKRLAKLEAVGQGDLHPSDPANSDDPKNRRIEITIHFIEPGKIGG
jgi:flagellar motor protein MotB